LEWAEKEYGGRMETNGYTGREEVMKLLAHISVLVSAAVLSGCASIDKTSHMVRTGGLAAEPMSVVERPLEYGVETLGDATGDASYKKFLWFTIEGDAAEMSLPIAGLIVTDPLEKIACYRAVQSLKGDGFYKILSETDSFNFLYIFRQKSVKVTGKVLKIKDLGMVDQKRADAFRSPPMIKETIVSESLTKGLKGSAGTAPTAKE